ncbi:hypothetical protein CSKR_105136 [Clonorchis sinensis]|uniref:Uncharacterized protein n=1 Tax=Clonorchis sinensis TaxID=79923 RepID=A0A3R7GB07_CLOSI|nr:hypothetical protein CSKR_105136 [Clonorchis sinensis]
MKHEGWDTARLPKPRQAKSRGRGRVRTTERLSYHMTTTGRLLPKDRFPVFEKYTHLQINLVFARDSPGTQLNLPFVMCVQATECAAQGRLMFHASLWCGLTGIITPEQEDDRSNESEMVQRLRRELADRKVHGSNPISASWLFPSRLEQPSIISDPVRYSSGVTARHREDATVGQFFLFSPIHRE